MRFSLVCILMFATLLPICAQDAVEIDIAIGYEGLVKTGRFNPVLVRLKNDGRDISGDLSVTTRRGTTYRTGQKIVYTKHIELPAQSRKRAFFSVPITSSGVPVSVRFEDKGTVIFEEELSVFGKVSYSQMLLALSRTAALNFLTAGRDLVVAYPHVETMPVRWDGYDPVDFVVIHDAEIGSFNDRQARALAQWVESGGTLLFSGGPHLAAHPSALDELLPVRIMGLARLESAAILSDYLETEIPMEGDVPVTMSTPKPGAVVIREDSVPVFVRKDQGKGRIYFFAGNIGAPPFSADAVRNALWDRVSGDHTGIDSLPEPGGVFEDQTLSALLDPTGGDIYGRYLLIGFLVVYLTGLMYFVLRKGKRQPNHVARWIAVALLTIGLAVTGYFLFSGYILNSNYLVAGKTTIAPSPKGKYARVEKDILVVSATGNTYDLSFDRPDLVVFARDEIDFRVREEAQTTLEAVPVRPWNQQSAKIITYIDFPLPGSLERNNNRLDLEFANRSDVTILDAVLIHRRVPLYIGTLSPGDVYTGSFERGKPLGSIEEADETYPARTHPIRYRVLNDMLRDETLVEKMEAGSIVLLGWLADPQIHTAVSEEFIRRRDVSILTTVFELTEESL